MRFDRLITLKLVRRMKPGVSDGRAGCLPILMYHSISNSPETGVPPYYRVCTSPDRFERQISQLAQMGFRGVTVSEGLEGLSRGISFSGNPVAITFDDGFRDVHDAALPVLKRHGFAASAYLPSTFIGDTRQMFKDRECMTWTEVAALQRSGIEIGSHTATHPVLYDLSWSEIEEELASSKEAIEQRLGSKVAGFSYPYAFPQQDSEFTSGFAGALKQAGYEHCLTTAVGTATVSSSPFGLPRLPVNDDDDDELFAAKLEGAYDWLNLPQRLVKTIKRRKRRVSDAPALGAVSAP
jgi:peptidoglycan/xylan/chitin deacetylase (PgdA/CDA1 family)